MYKYRYISNRRQIHEVKIHEKPNDVPSIHNVIIHTFEINIFRENWEINIYDVDIFQENLAIKFHKKTVFWDYILRKVSNLKITLSIIIHKL